MSSRLMQVLLAMSLLLNTFVLAGFVYRSWIAPPPFERHMPPPGPRPGPIEMVGRELHLEDSQREALRGLFEQDADARRERLREIQKLREQIAAEYRRPTIDVARVDAMIDQMTKLFADQQKATARSAVQLGAELKPDQRERMHQLLADRLSGPPTPRPPGPPPGRPSQ